MAISSNDRAASAPSMLTKFSGENIRSFRDPFEVSLVASTMAESRVVRDVPWRSGNARNSRVGVLPAAAFFGANGSGKSNVLRALFDMRQIVIRSFRSWDNDDRTERTPFRLDAASADGPSRFEVELILNGVLHRYGFVLDDHVILEEWAFRYPNGRAQRIFERDGEAIAYGSTSEPSTQVAGAIVRGNALLLSTSVALRGDELRPLYDWFSRNLMLAEAGNRDYRKAFTARQMQDPLRKSRILALLRAADLGVVDVKEVEQALPPEVQSVLDKLESLVSDNASDDTLRFKTELDNLINLVHVGVDGHRVSFKPEDESLGTTVWLGLVGPIIDALDAGSVLLADELDASLHPMLVEQIVHLFQDPETNGKRAQLLFNSHDAHLLGDTGSRILGRDQVWFTEKHGDGSSHLFPLTDLAPRKEESVSKRYLAGRYGAIPIVVSGDFEEAAKLEVQVSSV